MNLSRAAKKFRAEMPQEPKSKSVKERKLQQKQQARVQAVAAAPVAEVAAPVEEVAEVAAPAVEPVPEPVVETAAPTPTPKKEWPVKTKRPRFVREKVERRERATAPPLPDRSTKFFTRMMTQNLALPPKEDDTKLPR